MKIERGKYYFYPEEIELMGKIPDRMIAKIFDASKSLITIEREARGISGKGVAKSDKGIKAVLDSIDAPRDYYDALGLGELFDLEEERKKELKRQEQRKRKKERYRQEREKRQKEKEARKLERKKRAELGEQRGIFISVQDELNTAREQRAKELAAEKWQIFTGHPVNIDDFFEPESDFDRKRRLAIEQDTSNMNEFSRTIHDKPKRNPRTNALIVTLLALGLGYLLGSK